ncbi:MAG: hypothetical protein GKS06_05045 [Acidobacteria bacterium]|nr:hypothetical protein [Acidobacteriota bacterium]
MNDSKSPARATKPKQFIRSSRRVTRWTFVGVQLVVLLGCAALVSWVANYNPVSWDFTEEQFFSLSAQSRGVLQTLDQPVELVAFVQGGKSAGIERLLLAYEEASSEVSYRLVDPEADPALAAALGARGFGQVFVDAGGDAQLAAAIDEPSITNAVLAATRGEAVPVCFTVGHGERRATDSSREGLSAAALTMTQTNYGVRPVNLATEELPDECRALVIAGPEADFFATEIDALETFLDGGGRLRLLFESRTDVPNLAAFIGERFGFEVNDDFIIDTAKNGQQFNLGVQSPLVDAYQPHPITEDFGLMSLFTLPRSITFADERVSGLTALPLAMTSQGSWGETSVERGQVYTYDAETEVRGPLPLMIAVAVEVPETPRAYRVRMRDGGATPLGDPILVIGGDADFVSNGFFGWQGNGDLFLNSINWLTGQSELISIRPKEVANKRVLFTAENQASVFFLLVVLIPMLPAVTGAVIMFRKVK